MEAAIVSLPGSAFEPMAENLALLRFPFRCPPAFFSEQKVTSALVLRLQI